MVYATGGLPIWARSPANCLIILEALNSFRQCNHRACKLPGLPRKSCTLSTQYTINCICIGAECTEGAADGSDGDCALCDGTEVGRGGTESGGAEGNGFEGNGFEGGSCTESSCAEGGGAEGCCIEGCGIEGGGAKGGGAEGGGAEGGGTEGEGAVPVVAAVAGGGEGVSAGCGGGDGRGDCEGEVTLMSGSAGARKFSELPPTPTDLMSAPTPYESRLLPTLVDIYSLPPTTVAAADVPPSDGEQAGDGLSGNRGSRSNRRRRRHKDQATD